MKMIDAGLAKVGASASILSGSLVGADPLPEECRWLQKLVQHQDRRLEEFRLLQDLIVQANSGVDLSEILAWFKSWVFQVTVRAVPMPRRWKFFLSSDRWPARRRW